MFVLVTLSNPGFPRFFVFWIGPFQQFLCDQARFYYGGTEFDEVRRRWVMPDRRVMRH